MTKAVLIAIALFVIITFLYWKLTKGYVQKIHGKKMFKQWGSRMYYWHGVLYMSGGITVMVIFLLKSVNILGF